MLPIPHRGTDPKFLAHVCCGQTARWIKMPLRREVGLDPGDIVLDGAFDLFLANVNSRSLYAIARPSVCRLSVCLSVTFVRRTQAVQTFDNISTALSTLAIR